MLVRAGHISDCAFVYSKMCTRLCLDCVVAFINRAVAVVEICLPLFH